MTTTLYNLIERKTHDRRYERGIFDEEILRDGAYDQIRACTEDCLSNPHLCLRDVEKIVNAILDEITNALSCGERVELRGFGAFSVKHRDARVGRNPRTGAHVPVNEKTVPFFKTGKEMRERLNNGHEF